MSDKKQTENLTCYKLVSTVDSFCIMYESIGREPNLEKMQLASAASTVREQGAQNIGVQEENIDVLWKQIFKLYKANKIGEIVTLSNEYISKHPKSQVKVLILVSNLFEHLGEIEKACALLLRGKNISATKDDEKNDQLTLWQRIASLREQQGRNLLHLNNRLVIGFCFADLLL